MKAAGFSETLVAFGQFIRRNTQKPEVLILTALISLNVTEFYSKDLEERYYVGDLGVDGRVILK
jgi:hypothetical protein